MCCIFVLNLSFITVGVGKWITGLIVPNFSLITGSRAKESITWTTYTFWLSSSSWVGYCYVPCFLFIINLAGGILRTIFLAIFIYYLFRMINYMICHHVIHESGTDYVVKLEFCVVFSLKDLNPDFSWISLSVSSRVVFFFHFFPFFFFIFPGSFLR